MKKFIENNKYLLIDIAIMILVNVGYYVFGICNIDKHTGLFAFLTILYIPAMTSLWEDIGFELNGNDEDEENQ